MIKAIIFDYGGVVGNNPSGYILKAVSKEFKIGEGRIKDEFYKFIFLLEENKIEEMKFWRDFARNLDIENHKKLRRIWLAEFRKRAKIDKRIVSLAKSLKREYKLCLLSNKVIFYEKASINNLLGKIFSAVIYSSDVGTRKPNRGIYIHALNRLKCRADECVFIDDDPVKLSCPKKLGMKTILFKSFSGLKKELSEAIKKTE